MTDQSQVPTQLPPSKLAFIIDGIVVDVLHTDNRLAAIFLSDPTIIDITGNTSIPENYNIVGKTYDLNTKTFI
jgi:hypothetical protein